jgi:hypothetical protein
VHFESRVLTEWEKTHLPIILLTSEDWNPSQEVLRNGDQQSRESKEMRTIHSLTSGMTRQEINAIKRNEALGGRLGDDWMQPARHDIEAQHGMIPCTFNPMDFTERLISAVNIAMTYRKDVDQLSNERRASGIISNERHSAATPEDLARLWNIGLQTAEDTVWVMTQKGIRTAIHPMTRRVRVDHLHLHRQQLRGT